MNSVTLYSNGTAVIRRDYAFPDANPMRVAIPVRRADLDDVVSSLAVFGDVAVVGSPSYTPTNAAKATLPLDPQGALRDLLTKLAGAGVVVEVETGGTLEGRLVGVQPRRREYERSQLVDWQLVVPTDRGGGRSRGRRSRRSGSPTPRSRPRSTRRWWRAWGGSGPRAARWS